MPLLHIFYIGTFYYTHFFSCQCSFMGLYPKRLTCFDATLLSEKMGISNQNFNRLMSKKSFSLDDANRVLNPIGYHANIQKFIKRFIINPYKYVNTPRIPFVSDIRCNCFHIVCKHLLKSFLILLILSFCVTSLSLWLLLFTCSFYIYKLKRCKALN